MELKNQKPKVLNSQDFLERIANLEISGRLLLSFENQKFPNCRCLLLIGKGALPVLEFEVYKWIYSYSNGDQFECGDTDTLIHFVSKGFIAISRDEKSGAPCMGVYTTEIGEFEKDNAININPFIELAAKTFADEYKKFKG